MATYEDSYKLAYVRGPSGIIVMFAEKLTSDETLIDARRRVSVAAMLH